MMGLKKCNSLTIYEPLSNKLVASMSFAGIFQSIWAGLTAMIDFTAAQADDDVGFMFESRQWSDWNSPREL